MRLAALLLLLPFLGYAGEIDVKEPGQSTSTSLDNLLGNDTNATSDGNDTTADSTSSMSTDSTPTTITEKTNPTKPGHKNDGELDDDHIDFPIVTNPTPSATSASEKETTVYPTKANTPEKDEGGGASNDGDNRGVQQGNTTSSTSNGGSESNIPKDSSAKANKTTESGRTQGLTSPFKSSSNTTNKPDNSENGGDDGGGGRRPGGEGMKDPTLSTNIPLGYITSTPSSNGNNLTSSNDDTTRVIQSTLENTSATPGSANQSNETNVTTKPSDDSPSNNTTLNGTVETIPSIPTTSSISTINRSEPGNTTNENGEANGTAPNESPNKTSGNTDKPPNSEDVTAPATSEEIVFPGAENETTVSVPGNTGNETVSGVTVGRGEGGKDINPGYSSSGNSSVVSSTPSLAPTTTIRPDGTKVLNKTEQEFENCTMLVESELEYSNGTKGKESAWINTGCTTSISKTTSGIGGSDSGTTAATSTNPNVTTTPGLEQGNGSGGSTPAVEATTRKMKDGTKILSEIATAFANCTMLIEQVRQYSNGTTAAWAEWFDTGCATGMPVIPGDYVPTTNGSNNGASTKSTSTTTAIPTTRTLQDGTKVIEEVATAYHNCTMNFVQTLIYPNGTTAKNSTWVETGCTTSTPGAKTNTTTGLGIGNSGTSSGGTSSVTTQTTNTATKLASNTSTFTSSSPLPSAGCASTTLKNDSSNIIRIDGNLLIHSCASGFLFPDGAPLKTFECVAGKWSGLTDSVCQPATCPQLTVDLTNSASPQAADSQLSGRQPHGAMVIHSCKPRHVFPSGEPVRIYECKKDGTWAGNFKDGHCQYVEL